MNTYLIELRGAVDVNELNPMSPHQMTSTRVEPTKTLITVCTDQSGMIGLLRHLHNLGFVLLAVACELETSRTLSKRNE